MVAVFGHCDHCECTIAPSDKPARPPGSCGGIRWDENGNVIRTVEVFCPHCRHYALIDLPDGVHASEVFGPPNLLEYDDDPNGEEA